MKLPGWIRKQFRKKSRVYIIPTRMGGYFNGLIFLMFLLSVGYNNNLLLIFTLLLFGLNLLWVIQTHFHLHALKVQSVLVADGHAGESLDVSVFWKKTPSEPHSWKIILENDNKTLPVKVSSSAPDKTLGSIILPERGVWKFSHIHVSTEMPFGLYKVWIYYPLDVLAYAYPAKLKTVPDIQMQSGILEGDHTGTVIGPHDVKNLAPYQGEESRRISWKHYARSGELVIKEGEEQIRKEVHFRVSENLTDKELKLSQVATQMVHCARTEVMFSLETPLARTSVGVSSRHLSDCLKELALC